MNFNKLFCSINRILITSVVLLIIGAKANGQTRPGLSYSGVINKVYGDSDFSISEYFSSDSDGKVKVSINGANNDLISLNGTNNDVITILKSGTVTLSVFQEASRQFDEVTVNILLIIRKATLTVKAKDNERTYGDDSDPKFSFIYNGFKNGDGIDGSSDISGLVGLSGEVSAASTAKQHSNAGSLQTINIDVSQLSSTNYNFVADNTGIMTINRRALTVMADSSTRIYGDANPEFTFTYSGFINSDYVDSLNILDNISATSTATPESTAGSTHDIDIDLSSISDSNYEFQSKTGVLTITKAPLQISTEVNIRSNADFVDTIIVIRYSGFKNNDAIDGTTKIEDIMGFSGSINATSVSSGGKSIMLLDVIGLSTSNYEFTVGDTIPPLPFDEIQYRVRGKIIISKPDFLEVGKPDIIDARLTLGNNLSIPPDILSKGQIQVQEVDLTNRANILLSSISDIDIQAIEPKEQVLDYYSYTRWTWEVTAKSSGIKKLEVKIGVSNALPSAPSLPKFVPGEFFTVEAKETISSRLNTFRSFVIKNWKWIIGTLVLPIVLFQLGRDKTKPVKKVEQIDSTDFEIAPVWRRFLAFSIDFNIVLLITAAFKNVFFYQINQVWEVLLLAIILMAINILYSTLAYILIKSSLGKWAFFLSLSNREKQSITIKQIVIRESIKFPSFLALGFLWYTGDLQNRNAWDRVADTLVITKAAEIR